MSRTLINFAAFQLGWFSCVLSASNGMPWIGFLVVCMVVALHLRISDHPSHELQLITMCVAMGLVFDSLLVSSGWVSYPAGMLVPGIAPYWILAMWALFSTTLNYSMGWLKSNLVLASVMGAVFGPLSYLAGQRLGAIELLDYRSSMVALAVIWAVAMPVLTFAAGHFDGKRKPEPMIPVQKIPDAE